ncbi:MAG TPA: transposase [Candidatus Paceibacterota bacterium]
MKRKEPFVIGEYYHIYNRGIDKRIIFLDTQDYRRFVQLLYVANSTNSFELGNFFINNKKTFEDLFHIERGEPLVAIGAWALMPNHFHLVVRECTEGGITTFMKKLGTAYSMYFNIKYKRTGSLFGGLFKSKHIETDIYLQHLFGYVHLNALDLMDSYWESSITESLPSMWMSFLTKYSYSSFHEYNTTEARLESNILDKEKFPEYFADTHSFENFVTNYLMYREELT